MKRLTAVLVLAAAVTGAAAAQPGNPTERDLARLVASGAPGAVVLTRTGASTAVFESGYADTRAHEPIVVEDHFRVGSITKTFVATVVLQLVGERKLSLADTLQKRLPGLVPNGKKITIRELLQHTSGLYDYTNDPRTFAPYLTGKLGYTWKPRQLVAIAVTHKPLFKPGQTWSYSNTNYVLLGLVVEAVTKDSLANELARRIFTPLGLRQTRFEANTHVAPPAAHGYYKGLDITGLSGSVYWAAGAIVSTAGDIARFYAGLLGGKLLRPQQLKEMETTVPIGGNRYGLGIIDVQTVCGDAWGHNGIVPGYSSWAFSSRDGKRQAVVLATTKAFPSPSGFEESLNALAETAFCD